MQGKESLQQSKVEKVVTQPAPKENQSVGFFKGATEAMRNLSNIGRDKLKQVPSVVKYATLAGAVGLGTFFGSVGEVKAGQIPAGADLNPQQGSQEQLLAQFKPQYEAPSQLSQQERVEALSKWSGYLNKLFAENGITNVSIDADRVGGLNYPVQDRITLSAVNKEDLNKLKAVLDKAGIQGVKVEQTNYELTHEDGNTTYLAFSLKQNVPQDSTAGNVYSAPTNEPAEPTIYNPIQPSGPQYNSDPQNSGGQENTFGGGNFEQNNTKPAINNTVPTTIF